MGSTWASEWSSSIVVEVWQPVQIRKVALWTRCRSLMAEVDVDVEDTTGDNKENDR